MPNNQYAKLVQPLRLRTELIHPSFRGKIADFSLVYDEKAMPESPIWTETYHAYAPGTGVMAPSHLAPVVDGRPVEALRSVGQHAHNDFDEVYFFYGTDPIDNTRLGGQVEMWLGHGEDAQKFVMKDPTAVYVPKGLAHNPWIVTKVTDAKHPIMITTVALTKNYSLEPRRGHELSVPPDVLPGPHRGAAARERANTPTWSTDSPCRRTSTSPSFIGRVCTPNLMFDDKVCRAPLWAEFFLVYAGGTGVGVPTLADIAKNDAMSYWDWTKGMQHYQSYDEVFLYLPTDPYETLDLGGEAVAYLGDEGYSITEPSAVYVPGKVLHNPNYYKRVDRPYYMIVLAMTDNAKFHEGEFTPVPAPDTFRF